MPTASDVMRIRWAVLMLHADRCGEASKLLLATFFFISNAPAVVLATLANKF